MDILQHFGIIGAGAWGTALGAALACAGRDVTLWALEDEVASGINTQHANPKYLHGVTLDARIRATTNLQDLARTDVWLLVAPVQFSRRLCQQIAAAGSSSKQPIIVCCKGIEQTTLALPSEIVAAELPGHPVVILSGPTFAAEVARDQPTAATLAAADAAFGGPLAQAIGSRHFRPYLSDDIIGAQMGGAIKNVLAIAAGICTGCGLGDNARAALITRGLAEMMRLGKAMGGRAETLMGLSGLGDLVLTCSSVQSRNMSLGIALGQGQRLKDILAVRHSVAEGVHTAVAALALAQKHEVDMPITEAVEAILNKGSGVLETIAGLLARPLKLEGI
ncbi:MAG: NAD(P)-dependent glycerol-3-phosphate dehydrogenase [Alphaproteobacteria bacterium]|nr:NAD(P)-dependent glycerol-3-phosphate dehydrogenase [Alphaproteobacteria bacterium]